MKNPENAQISADERAVAQAEAALKPGEDALSLRLQACSPDPRIPSILSRIQALETAGAKSPDLAKARTILEAGNAPEPVFAAAERGAAATSRRGAIQTREVALRALTATVTQLEITRGAQRKELEAAETAIANAERALQQAKTAPPRPAASMPPPIASAPPPARAPAPPPAAARPSAPPPAAPPPPASAPRTAPGPAPMPAPEMRPAVSSSAAVQVPTTASAALRKLSKRRRVKLAPPPKRMEVDVAVYGDNTFYAGFDNRLASGGLFVASLETLPVGHELELTIDLEGKQIKTRGRVEFTRADNTANPECTGGAGIKLQNLPGDAVSAIEAFFQKRAPMFILPIRAA